MKKAFILILMAISACKTVPITGRKQINLVPNAMLTTLSFTAYNAIVKSSTTLPKEDEREQMVKRVGTKMQQDVEIYLQQNGMSKDLKNFKWDYNTIDEASVNALMS